MFRDCWDYICYKIQDMILKNGQKQNRKKQENINRTTHRTILYGDHVVFSNASLTIERGDNVYFAKVML